MNTYIIEMIVIGPYVRVRIRTYGPRMARMFRPLEVGKDVKCLLIWILKFRRDCLVDGLRCFIRESSKNMNNAKMLLIHRF